MYNANDIDELNAEVEQWNIGNKKDLVAQMDSLGIKHSKNSPNKTPLAKALKGKVFKKFGVASKITYSMPRSAVFLAKGVSRGHGIGNPRTGKDFYNPVINKNIDKLADIVADNYGNMILNAIEI